MNVVPAIEIETAGSLPRPYGLYSVIDWDPVARPENDDSVPNNVPGALGDRWLGGVTWRPDAASQDLHYWDQTCGVDPSAKTTDDPPAYEERGAFVLYRREKCSTTANSSTDAAARAEAVLRAESEKYLETALYLGWGGSSTGFALDATLLTGGSPPKLTGAIALLEESWNGCSSQLGVLHVPRFAYPYLVQCASQVFRDVDGRLYTAGGTPVILGAGYTNKKPDGNGPSTGQIVLQMTGRPFGFRSEVLVTGADDAEIDRDLNDRIVTAEQEFVVGWNSSCAYAAVGETC